MLILSRRKGESLFIGEIKVTVANVARHIGLECEGQMHIVPPGRHMTIRPDIHIYVAGRQAAQVRLGITAPADVLILREELRK